MALTVSCAGPGGSADATQGAEMSCSSIVAAQEALTESVMELPGVVGTAVGLCGDTPCIKVYVAAVSHELRERIPDTYRGFQVDVEVTGEFRARPARTDTTD